MKTARLLMMACALFFAAACNKTEPIPSDKEKYIGLWQPVKPDPEAKTEILINADGTGRYTTVKKAKQVEYTGNVYFRGANDFSIGGKLIKKKIRVNRPPVKIIDNLTPLEFHWEAEFNDVQFTRVD